jgi:bacteriocin-like protein
MTTQKQMTEKELDQVSGGPVYVKIGDKESPSIPKHSADSSAGHLGRIGNIKGDHH